VTISAPDALPAYYVSPYALVRAVGCAGKSGVSSQSCSEGGLNLTSISNGDWIMMRNVDFGSGASTFLARVAGSPGGTIQLRLDSLTGPIIGTCSASATAGTQVWATSSCPIDAAAARGVHDLYLLFSGGTGTSIFNFNWWQFESAGAIPAAPTDLTAQSSGANQIALSWTGAADSAQYTIKRLRQISQTSRTPT
jgi:hypothetical protein